MENILPRREARENAFLLAFSQTFGDIPLQEALDNHHECDEEHPVDVFGQRLLRAYYEHSAEVDDLISAHLRNWTMVISSSTACWVRWHASRVWTQSLSSCEQLYAGHRHQQLCNLSGRL